MRVLRFLPAVTLLGAAPAAFSLAQAEEDSYVNPYDTLPIAPGAMDDAVPAPQGTVFYQPAEEGQPLQSDEELAAIAPTLSGAELHAIRKVSFVQHEDGLWMRGRTYKGRAFEGGFSYIPFLGADAPRNFPVTFRLESATLAGAALALSPSATVTRDGQRIVLDRGPVDVVYETRLDEVEQLFVLDAAGAAGDLVLQLQVTSELKPVEHGEGFLFEGPRGGMTYGAAIVLDGNGRRASVPAELSEGHLTLTVPAQFLAAAEGTIVVDPILETFTVDTVSGEQRKIDVSFDGGTNTFMYVYEDTFSNADADIYSTVLETDGTFVDGGVVFGNSQTWRDPSVANLNGEDVHLVVASGVAANGFSEIRGRIYDVATENFGAEFLIADTGAVGFEYGNIRPDVGDNSTSAAGAEFLVGWERNFSPTQTLARFRTVQGDGTLGATTFLENGTDVEQEEVVISESTGNAATVNVWNVAWRNENLSTNKDTIRGIRFNASGAAIGTPRNIYTAPGTDRLREIDITDSLVLNGFDPTYLITFDNYSSSTNEATIMVVRNNFLLRTHQLSDLEHADPASRRDVQLGATRDRFIATYIRESENDVYISVLELIESSFIGVAERRVVLGSTEGAFAGGAAIATRFSGGLVSRFAGVAWSFLDTNGDLDVTGAYFAADTPAIPVYHYCTSPPNSTGDYSVLLMTGSASNTTNKTVTAYNLPPFQFTLLLVGTVPTNNPGAGGGLGAICVGGQFGRYLSQIQGSDVNGVVTFNMDPTAIPSSQFGPVVALPGERYYWQAWHRDGTGGVASSNTTNAIGIRFE